MTERKYLAPTSYSAFFGMKENVTSGLSVYQCQLVGDSILGRALGTVYFAKEHLDKPFLILTSVLPIM